MDSLKAPCEMREQYWSELTVNEKADRMRMIVKELKGQISLFDELITKLLSHAHVDDRIVISITDGPHQFPMRGSRGIQGDDVFF